MIDFIKYMHNYKYSNFMMVLLFFSTPLYLNNSLNRLFLSQTLSYKAQYITFDYFTITPPGKRRGVVFYENAQKKKLILLSNIVSAADVFPYKEYKGVAAYLELDTGEAEPRRRLLEIRFNGISKIIGHTQNLPDKQERIASARRHVGYSILMLTVGIIWLLYALYQLVKKTKKIKINSREIN